jgi:hypothetical protein
MNKLTNNQKLALIMVLILAFFLLKSRKQEDTHREVKPPEKPIVKVIDEPTTPVFEDFPTDESATGTLAKVDFSGNNPALQFRTQITKTAAKGPNFAGRYTVVTWGCGSACQQTAIVDEVTGKIVSFNLMTSGGVDYRLNSRLLIAHTSSPNAKPGPEITQYYVIRGDELRLNGLIDPGTGIYVPFQAD